MYPVLFSVGSAFIGGRCMRGGMPFMRGGFPFMRGGFPGVFGHHHHRHHSHHCGERAFFGGLIGGLAGGLINRFFPGLGVGRDIANYNAGASDGYMAGSADGYVTGYNDGLTDGLFW